MKKRVILVIFVVLALMGLFSCARKEDKEKLRACMAGEASRWSSDCDKGCPDGDLSRDQIRCMENKKLRAVTRACAGNVSDVCCASPKSLECKQIALSECAKVGCKGAVGTGEVRKQKADDCGVWCRQPLIEF